MLINYWFVTDISEQPIGLILEGEARTKLDNWWNGWAITKGRLITHQNCATSQKRADHIYVEAGAWQQAGSQYFRLLKDDPPRANSDTRTTDLKAVF